MWDYDLISVNWTGQAFTGEQLVVLRNVAAHYLRSGRKYATFNFRHLLCEGTIKRTNEGSYGTFSGTFFHADCGTFKGERWTCDFLLPRGTERLLLSEDSSVLMGRMLPGGDFGVRKVDVGLTGYRDGDVVPSARKREKPRKVTRDTVI